MLKLLVSKGRNITRGLQMNSKGYIRVFVREGMHINPRTGEVNSMVELAKAATFGTATTPPRPFLVDSLRELSKEIDKIVKSSMVWRFKGLTADVQYEFAANDIAHAIRQFIKSGEYYKATQPNASYTIAQKGSDIPLVDSGQLVEHIEAEYVRT